AIEPVVGDDAVRARRAAGVNGGMSGARESIGIGIVAILEPGAIVAEATEAALAEQLVPAEEVVAAQLVEDDHDRQPHPRFAVLAAFVGRRDCRWSRGQAAEPEGQRERPAR